jgi:hypothetical protein
MAWHVARPIIKYDDTFFDWLQPQMLMVDDYAYARLDFRGDLDLVLQEDAQWGELGKKYTHFFLFKCFYEFFHIQMFFVLYVRPKTKYKIVVDDMDVGPYRPPGTSPIQQ